MQSAQIRHVDKSAQIRHDIDMPLAAAVSTGQPIRSDLILSDLIRSNLILSYPMLSDPIRSYPILSDPILSDLILSVLISSYPILSYPILSDPIRSDPPKSSQCACPRYRKARASQRSASQCSDLLGVSKGTF
jgi:hypothetical protein